MDPLSPYTAAARPGLSLLPGAVVGKNREHKKKPAGIRMHVLISAGSTLFMLESIHVPDISGGGNGDLTRIAARIVSGVGVIMRQGLNIIGDAVQVHNKIGEKIKLADNQL